MKIQNDTKAMLKEAGWTQQRLAAEAGKRGLHLQANIGHATKHSYRQFRYIFFLKRHWVKRLNLKIKPYPKQGDF